MAVSCGPWPSKNNRQGPSEGCEPPESHIEPSDLLGDTGSRPLSVEPDRKLRDEAVQELAEGPQAQPWYAVIESWRDWMHDYRGMHIEYEKDGETARTRLENSYQPQYGKRYYAKLKDFERGVSRRWSDVTTAMLTFTASTENAQGQPRCPADHMRDIAGGWDTARKQLHQALSGTKWEYCRVWEPHKTGYGHLHVAVFVEDSDVSAQTFKPVMGAHVRECKPAGTEAHTVEEAVSVNDDVENIGSYISEYIGCFGEDPTERGMHEQMFYAVTWATGTRRVDFSNGAQSIIAGEEFRRETGLKPSQRGEANTSTSDTETAQSDAESDEGEGWEVGSVCKVQHGKPEYHDPASGGALMTAIDGRPGMDPPAERD